MHPAPGAPVGPLDGTAARTHFVTTETPDDLSAGTAAEERRRQMAKDV